MDNEINSETRVRMNASQNAKGLWQLDITTESPSVEKSRELFASALNALCVEIEKMSGVIVKAN
jgi:hypothetical protein